MSIFFLHQHHSFWCRECHHYEDLLGSYTDIMVYGMKYGGVISQRIELLLPNPIYLLSLDGLEMPRFQEGEHRQTRISHQQFTSGSQKDGKARAAERISRRGRTQRLPGAAATDATIATASAATNVARHLAIAQV